MTQDDIIQFVTDLSGVVVVKASKDNGAPEVAWGDTFIFYDPDGTEPANRKFPFATIVIKDYDGFDNESNLNRPGMFRLNVNVGRDAFTEIIGYPPSGHPDHHDQWDYTAADRILPHPVYAEQAWVSIVNPDEETAVLAQSILEGAHTQAVRRHRPRT